MMRKLALILILAALATRPAAAGTLSAGLRNLMQDLDDQDVIRVLVVMQDRPDVAALDKSLHAQGVTLHERHRNVVTALQRSAATAQADLLADLGADKAAGGVVGFAPHWIVNSVVVTATVAAIREIAARPDVDQVEVDLQVEPMEPVSVKTAAVSPDKGDKGFLTPGLAAINAPRVWHELGIDGTGTIVAGLDSGVDRTHPALASRWRGNAAPARECWQDAAGFGYPDAPVDFHGHGTHTMGTITGASWADTMGVAPGAMWIASNAIAAGTTLDNPVIAAFEWLADPDGNPETSDDVPDVVQNSWGVTAASGQYLACDTRWYDVIDNCEAAGVVVVWSAGNEGPGPSSLRSPPNRASTPTSSFSVGSTRTVFPYLISSFSSRGPSQCGGPFAIKPEVVAPGQDILSAYPGGQYAYMSGTSMAGPHVAGVVALMRQARPNLDVVTIKEILMETAVDLGSAGEDNDYGHGLIDAYAAVLVALNEIGTITGTVTDGTDGRPLDGVLVRDTLGLISKTTGPDGTFAFTLRAGARPVAAEKFGYATSLLTLPVPAGGTVVHDIVLERAPWSRVSGLVTGPDSQPLAGVEVAVLNTPVAAAVTDGSGRYVLDLPSGEGYAYVLRATAPGLAYDLRHVGLERDAAVDFHLPLPRADGFETGVFATFAYTHGGAAPWTIGGDEAQEGLLSARSGAIGHGQQTTLTVAYYANGSGEFSFWHKTDSEIAYDVLTVAVDGSVRGTWSGARAWTRFATELAEGLHTITWTYRKDSSASVGRDAAWIDAISFPGTGVQPFAQAILDTDAVAATIPAGSTATAELTLTNGGSLQLDFSASLALAGPGGSVPTWTAVSPAAGSVHPFNDTVLVLSFDGAAAPAGRHDAVLTLQTNDPAAPTVLLPVTLTVDAVSAVGDNPPPVLAIDGVVPNPFNPATSLRFTLPHEAAVRLRLYDVAGRLVRTLVDGPLPAGRHERRWDGRDDGGRAVASGVYFARLQAGTETRIRPMTLVR